MLRRWGWVVPFSLLRRALLRWLLNRVWFRRKLSGTFQLTVIPTVDMVCSVAAIHMGMTAVLAAGQIRERVIAVDGPAMPISNPTMILTCCFDHQCGNGVWMLTRSLSAVKAELERPVMPGSLQSRSHLNMAVPRINE